MTDRIDELIAALMELPDADRDRIARQVAKGAYQVADGSARMKSIVLLLPDDLASQAKAAGLLGDRRIEELVRRALREEPQPKLFGERKLIRQNGRLVVNSLEGEEPITDEDVRAALDKMDW